MWLPWRLDHLRPDPTGGRSPTNPTERTARGSRIGNGACRPVGSRFYGFGWLRCFSRVVPPKDLISNSNPTLRTSPRLSSQGGGLVETTPHSWKGPLPGWISAAKGPGWLRLSYRLAPPGVPPSLSDPGRMTDPD
jgi:hypothetical protein